MDYTASLLHYQLLNGKKATNTFLLLAKRFMCVGIWAKKFPFLFLESVLGPNLPLDVIKILCSHVIVH